MDQRIKDLLYMAVGLASTSQKIKVLLDKMHIEGKLTEDEGKRIVNELFENTKNTADNFKDEIGLYIQDILNELKTPTLKEFEELKTRIAKLEAELHRLKANEN
ncbi:MAG: phasin family protein [Bacteroidia bacterium]